MPPFLGVNTADKKAWTCGAFGRGSIGGLESFGRTGMVAALTEQMAAFDARPELARIAME